MTRAWTPGDALLDGWTAFRRDGLIVAGPLVLLNVVLGALGTALPAVSVRSAPPAIAWQPAALVGALLAFLLGAFVWLVANRAALDGVLTGRRADLTAAARGARTAYARSLLPLLVVGTLLLVGLALFVLPGLVVAALLFPVTAVLLVEGEGLGALRRAFALTEGHRVTLALVTLAVSLLAFVLALPLGLVPVVGLALVGVVQGLAAGFGACLVASFYVWRTRTDAPA